MKRGITRGRRTGRASVVMALLLCLLLGAVVNVLVAWGCVISAPSLAEERWIPRAEVQWLDRVPDEWPRVGSNYTMRYGLGNHALHGRGFSEAGWAILETLHAGWPVVALRCSSWIQERGGVASSPDDWYVGWIARGIPIHGVVAERLDRLGLGLVLNSMNEVRLPVRPLWLGFAINTLFYTFIIGSVWFALGAIRRVLRRRAGKCVKCAYDLRGNTSGVCPECSTPTACRAAEPTGG